MDYKVIAKAISLQLGSMLADMIHPDQAYAVLGHTIFDNLQLQVRSTAGCPLSGQLYALVIEPFLCLLHRRLTGLVLWEPELQLVLSTYTDDVLLVVQDPGDLVRVEACQAVYLAASSAWVSWVKALAWWLGMGGR
ncbi:unnamed protein product [Caretta caretta]